MGWFASAELVRYGVKNKALNESTSYSQCAHPSLLVMPSPPQLWKVRSLSLPSMLTKNGIFTEGEFQSPAYHIAQLRWRKPRCFPIPHAYQSVNFSEGFVPPLSISGFGTETLEIERRLAIHSLVIREELLMLLVSWAREYGETSYLVMHFATTHKRICKTLRAGENRKRRTRESNSWNER